MGECCMPDQISDCRVAVKDNRLSDWLGLKASCDNRTSCNYEYLGSVVDECETNQVAEYLQVYYTCGTGKILVYIIFHLRPTIINLIICMYDSYIVHEFQASTKPHHDLMLT